MSGYAEVKFDPMPHQERVSDKLKAAPEGQGLLAAHDMGTGKTFTAIHSANQLNKPILAITPASLRENFKKELKATGTTGAHVMSYHQALKQMHDPKFRERAMNSLVVMDEAHNIGHAESDRSALSDLPGQKLLLTGTTIRNRPHEIAPLINAVSPGSLPISEEAFNDKYVATRELPVSFWGRMKGQQPGVVHIPMNLDQFGKAVRGKIDFHENIDRSNYPSFKESIVEVPMSQKQQDTYQFALGKYPMLSYKIQHGIPPSKSESKNLTAFLNGPRQVSNTPVGFNSSARDEDAPKFKAAADEIQKRMKSDKNFRGVTYSNYLESGVEPMSRELTRRGIKHIVYTGKMNDKQKREAVDAYNKGDSPVLLISSAGGEGLDLKGTKLMQIMEPHWHEEKINQVRGRAIRYRSHSHLPLKERHVEVQRFHSVTQQSFFRRMMDGKATGNGVDQYIYNLAQEKHNLNQAFIDVLKRESKHVEKKEADFEPDDGMIWVELKGDDMAKAAAVLNMDPDTTTHKPFAVKGMSPPKLTSSVGGVYSPGKDKIAETMKFSSLSVAATGALVGLIAGEAARRAGAAGVPMPTSGPIYDSTIGTLAALFAKIAPEIEEENAHDILLAQHPSPSASLM
jgi:superfamily II DNA or RNA helicase